MALFLSIKHSDTVYFTQRMGRPTLRTFQHVSEVRHIVWSRRVRLLHIRVTLQSLGGIEHTTAALRPGLQNKI